MIRTDCGSDKLFDPELERTARKLRKQARKDKEIVGEFDQPTVEDWIESESEEEDDMENNNNNRQNVVNNDDRRIVVQEDNRTFREHMARRPDRPNFCINFPDAEADFEIKSGLIHHLPKFHGIEREDPNKHIKAFYGVCAGMKPQGVELETILLRAFPFSLEDAAKNWLYNLPAGAINSWNNLETTFLDKYFPVDRAIARRLNITSIKQQEREPFHEY